jgi:murein DD-endopeptidase MepM/ murein hydrolase activator NlpD
MLRIMAATGVVPRVRPARVLAQGTDSRFSYPVGLPERPLGDGLFIRHGYATENTWYNPGWWHTGEDWYLTEGESAGVAAFAAAAGEVVYASGEYPGRVVIIAHDDGLYSMYGHLDYALAIEQGQSVARGQQLGTILARTDGRASSHLHFEMRTFFTTPEVNGEAPRYDVGCGYDCPPGPGYWPIDAPEHPSAIGWRNPTHVINHRAWGDDVPQGVEVIVAANAPANIPLWTAPANTSGAESAGDLALSAGDRYPLLAIDAGEEDASGTSAEAYRLWYQIALLEGNAAWVQAAVPSGNDTGTDGRPSSVRFHVLPAAFMT